MTLALATLVRRPPLDALQHPWYAAALLTTVGVVLASRGRLRAEAIVGTARVRDLPTGLGATVGACLLVALAWWTGPAVVPRAGVLLLAVAQPVLLATWYRWADASAEPRAYDPRLTATLVIGVLAVGHLTLIPLRLADAYPFAVYAMYSQARLDPYVLERVVFVADEEMADERQLRAPASRQALLDLIDRDDLADLENIAGRVAESHDVERVTVYLEEVRVASHPERPTLTVDARRELVTVAR